MKRRTGIAPDYLYFNGKRYGLNRSFTRKADAQEEAERFRGKGYLVRIVRRMGLGGKKLYFSYIRATGRATRM